MKKEIKRFKSVNEYHKLANLPKPEHPLVSLIDYSLVNYQVEEGVELTWIQDYYSIALKRNINVKLRYGQQEYDFDEGLMSFFSPGQLMNMTLNTQASPKPSGWVLLLHPDFLWNTPLAKSIKKYEFLGYSVNESLFLSKKEEVLIANILKNIQQEYHSNIDKFSQNIIISQIEVLLNYAERFYQRQFITRKITNHQILGQLENTLADYFNNEDLITKGLPTVQYISEQLNVSSNYLSNLLKSITGQNTQQHIHEKLIVKAKEKLSTTNLSISEIAYELGFEHSQSFSRLFKNKVKISPLEFRSSFN